VPQPIKLLEGIGNGGNGALVRSTVILWTNDQHFILLRSIGVYGKQSPVEHLRIYFVPMPACTTLPPNANFGLSDWSKWSSGFIYVSALVLSLPCISALSCFKLCTFCGSIVLCHLYNRH